MSIVKSGRSGKERPLVQLVMVLVWIDLDLRGGVNLFGWSGWLKHSILMIFIDLQNLGLDTNKGIMKMWVGKALDSSLESTEHGPPVA